MRPAVTAREEAAMYGDTRVIRRLASGLRGQGEQIRREADELVGRAEAVEWRGWAADAMRARARDRATDLRRTARAHDDAADALDRHAAEVDRLKELIGAIERRFVGLVAAARDRLAALGHQLLDGVRGLLPDPLDELLDRFAPPPHGHLDWLHVDLPGLR
ncbi:MAG: hypothetical protein U0R80_14195 [Nocardioidaceae bacterium]